MTAEAAEDFRKMGLVIDVFAVQHIQDEHGYLDSLGRKRTAEVVRDAEIGEADATRDSLTRTAAADREGKTARFQADVAIASAEKEKNLQVAAFAAEVNAKNAQAAQAGPLADAKARQEVKREEIRVIEIETESRIAVAQREAERKRKELEGTKVAEAEAAKTAAILKAEGDKAATILAAEAEKQRKVVLAEADAKELEFEGLGEASKIAKIAEAESGRVRIVGQAEADAIKARGLAEAEAMQKKAEALKLYGEAAMMQMVVEKLPEIARAFAEPLASIDKVSIMEIGGGGNGGGGAGGSGGLNRFMGSVGGGMAAMSEFVKQSFGIDLAEVAKSRIAQATPAGPAATADPSLSGQDPGVPVHPQTETAKNPATAPKHAPSEGTRAVGIHPTRIHSAASEDGPDSSRFVASERFRPSHPSALAVYCSDGRFTRAVEQLLESKGCARVDTLTMPGGPALFSQTGRATRRGTP